jgi:hypothetical protein
VLVLGKAGSAGTTKGVLPVPGEGSVVVTVQPSGRTGIAAAVVRLHAERTSSWHDRTAASTALTVAGIGAST